MTLPLMSSWAMYYKIEKRLGQACWSLFLFYSVHSPRGDGTRPTRSKNLYVACHHNDMLHKPLKFNIARIPIDSTMLKSSNKISVIIEVVVRPSVRESSDRQFG